MRSSESSCLAAALLLLLPAAVARGIAIMDMCSGPRAQTHTASRTAPLLPFSPSYVHSTSSVWYCTSKICLRYDVLVRVCTVQAL